MCERAHWRLSLQILYVSGDHMSLPNRNFLGTITIPCSQDAVQEVKEKILFSQPQLLPLKLMSTEKYQLSLLNIVAGAQSILETGSFSDGSVWAAHFTKTAYELQNQYFGSVNISIPAPIIDNYTCLLKQNLCVWVFSV